MIEEDRRLKISVPAGFFGGREVDWGFGRAVAEEPVFPLVPRFRTVERQPWMLAEDGPHLLITISSREHPYDQEEGGNGGDPNASTSGVI